MTRIYHTWDKWECYRAGFFEDKPPKGMTRPDAVDAYATFLRDGARFADAAARVIAEWPMSCEHNLTNENMNRLAWIGQASMCLATGIPAAFRGGFNRLTEQAQYDADQVALRALNTWLERRGDAHMMRADAQSKTLAELY